MKRILLLVFSALMLLCSCEHLFESRKEKLDRLVATHWDSWRSEGEDTTKCIIDFSEIMPFEWDTIVYADYYGSRDYDSKELKSYMNERYWKERERAKGSPGEHLHFWKDGKLVYDVYLLIASDDEKGVLFSTKRKFIVRTRNNAKFYVEKERQFYLVYEIRN